MLGLIVAAAGAGGAIWYVRNDHESASLVLHISNQGIFLNRKLVSRVINGDIEEKNRLQGADYELFKAMDAAARPAGAGPHEYIPRLFEVHIDRDVSIKLVRRELLAAQQAEFLSLNLRVPDSCGQLAGLVIPFLSYHALQQHTPVNVMIEHAADWTVTEVDSTLPPNLPKKLRGKQKSRAETMKESQRQPGWKFPGAAPSDALMNRIESSAKKWSFESLFYYADDQILWGRTEDFICRLKQSRALQKFVEPFMASRDGQMLTQTRRSKLLISA
jgi:hypothetical protein